MPVSSGRPPYIIVHMAKRINEERLRESARRGRSSLISGVSTTERVHLHLYLPADLVRRLRSFHAQHHDQFPRLSRVVARALEEFLERYS